MFGYEVLTGGTGFLLLIPAVGLLIFIVDKISDQFSTFKKQKD